MKQKDFAHELPKMAFQDQFIAINVDNISPTVFKEKKEINDFKFLGKQKAAAKTFVDNGGQSARCITRTGYLLNP